MKNEDRQTMKLSIDMLKKLFARLDIELKAYEIDPLISHLFEEDHCYSLKHNGVNSVSASFVVNNRYSCDDISTIETLNKILVESRSFLVYNNKDINFKAFQIENPYFNANDEELQILADLNA